MEVAQVVVLAIVLAIVKQVVLVNVVRHVGVRVPAHAVVIVVFCVVEDAMGHVQNNAVKGVLAARIHVKIAAVVVVHKDVQMDANCLARTSV